MLLRDSYEMFVALTAHSPLSRLTIKVHFWSVGARKLASGGKVIKVSQIVQTLFVNRPLIEQIPSFILHSGASYCSKASMMNTDE